MRGWEEGEKGKGKGPRFVIVLDTGLEFEKRKKREVAGR